MLLCRSPRSLMSEIFRPVSGLMSVTIFSKSVISDIEMPEMDGHRLTKLIKTDEATAKIPVVLFSSLVNEEMRRKGESLGGRPAVGGYADCEKILPPEDFPQPFKGSLY